MGRPVKSLEEALDTVLDPDLTEPEVVRARLDELGEIAEAEGLKYEYIQLLFNKVTYEESHGENI